MTNLLNGYTESEDLDCCGEDCGEEDCCDGFCCSEETECCESGCLDEDCCLLCSCDRGAPAYALMDLMQVSVPEGKVGDMVVERFTVKRMSLENLRNAQDGRETRGGEYTRLLEFKEDGGYHFDGTFWMSDVDAERRDHLPAVRRISQPETNRVLIHGLGIGMVLRAAMTFDHVQHIDVVERDERVIQLVGPHYAADPRVHIHHADVYQQGHAWPQGTRWDVIWSDIWPDISTDNAEMMRLLKRIYAGKADWHGFWGADTMRKQYGVRV